MKTSNKTTSFSDIKIESVPKKERRRDKERREFIDWLDSLDDGALTRQGEKIWIHICLTPENKKWQEAKEDYNKVAKHRGFDSIK